MGRALPPSAYASAGKAASNNPLTSTLDLTKGFRIGGYLDAQPLSSGNVFCKSSLWELRLWRIYGFQLGGAVTGLAATGAGVPAPAVLGGVRDSKYIWSKSRRSRSIVFLRHWKLRNPSESCTNREHSIRTNKWTGNVAKRWKSCRCRKECRLRERIHSGKRVNRHHQKWGERSSVGCCRSFDCLFWYLWKPRVESLWSRSLICRGL